MKIIKEEKQETCFGDIITIITYKSEDNIKRDYSIKKQYFYNGKKEDYVYLMYIEDDKYVLPLTEDKVKEILNSPEIGQNIAYNIWMSRYR